MGWSKRGNDKSYDSLNGYAAIIGLMSKKVLDYTTRNRKCSKCDKCHNKNDHDCRKNFDCSAKSMESDAGVQLVNRSNILKEKNLNVGVMISDDDSTTISAIKKDNKMIFKMSDNNHLKKNFTKDLYSLSNNYNELKKEGVIKHMRKFFAYAVQQNSGQTSSLVRAILNIPDHLYNHHENCGNWCSRNNAKKSQTVILTDQLAYEPIRKVFHKYAKNASKFCKIASSRSNESLSGVK